MGKREENQGVPIEKKRQIQNTITQGVAGGRLKQKRGVSKRKNK